ncbi:aminoacylase-1 [Anaeramoeba ignava]|uniref:N-acyl-aliphatic-L-amino acid amidohydrolase n=1 Tax=Anaeramoeba ignava TaxID=1746090 RepID=A0A9Q0LGG5_ANAIG|nr:aminoacylase-1 [Anaeramoeba ignava]
MNSKDERVLNKFKQYLQIQTVHPNPNYEEAIKFLENYSKEFLLNFESFELVKDNPIGHIFIEGTEPNIPSILLNSHIDVVPADTNNWKFDPFSAKEEDNKIYARGTQDMKCVGIQHLESIGRLVESGFKFKRSIHITFVPGEEVGGHVGMEMLVKSGIIKKWNIGVAFDEGLANPSEKFTVFYGEKAPWWILFTAEGNVGHGSQFIENTAIQKIYSVMTKLTEFRNKQLEILKKDPNKTISDVHTLNITQIKAATPSEKSINVIPSKATLACDIRITPKKSMEEIQKLIDEICESCNVQYQFLQHTPINNLTDLESQWFKTFESSCKELGIEIEPQIFPAATDSRYLRQLGIPAIGFSPMNNTPILLHGNNEFLDRDIFLKGVHYFMKIFSDISKI